MEALLEKEADVESWNDERMDELSRRVDDGFKEMREGFVRVDREMKEGFARVDREMKEGSTRVDREMKVGFAQVGDRIDRLTNTIIIGGAGFCAAIVAAAVFG
ncbi:MAG: hypothetical protein E6G51_06790 [Actinobacteria bacterium]|nr:MAG: hypothetical protein E6G51_06790 [Actinomycetota bacterium]